MLHFAHGISDSNGNPGELRSLGHCDRKRLLGQNAVQQVSGEATWLTSVACSSPPSSAVSNTRKKGNSTRKTKKETKTRRNHTGDEVLK